MSTCSAPRSVELQPPTPAATDPDVAAQQALFKALVVTVGHFFGSFAQLFGALTEHRDPARLTYPLPVLMATGVLMFLLRLGARRQIAALLRANGPSRAKYQAMSPHRSRVSYR